MSAIHATRVCKPPPTPPPTSSPQEARASANSDSTVNTTTTTTNKRRRHSPSLSIDLSDLPPLTTPTAPSNTLIITNLIDPLIFLPHNLQSIRNAISEQASLHTFSPLKSFRRIIVSFHTVEAATCIRQLLDGERVLDSRIRVYYGEPTPLNDDTEAAAAHRHLAAPPSQKLFFISPPPSPPVGWETRNEDPPNREVHAEDLVSALHRLDTMRERERLEREELHRPGGAGQMLGTEGTPTSCGYTAGRNRSSTLVFDPEQQGAGPGLPAIEVEDTGADEDDETAAALLQRDEQVQGASVHTARPPVELMES